MLVAVRDRRTLLLDADARADARPRGRHRLRAVHRCPGTDRSWPTGWTARRRAGRAVGTAGSARSCSPGSPCVIALAGLAVVGHPVPDRRWASPPPATVAVAVLVALTLLPALIGFAGRGCAARGGRCAAARGATASGRRNRCGRGSSRRRPVVTLVVGRGLGLLADRRPGARPAARPARRRTAAARRPPSARRTTCSPTGFGPGFNGPLVVSSSTPPTTADAGRGGEPRRPTRSRALPDVVVGQPAVVQPGRGDDRDAALVVSSRPARPTTQETADLVHAIRDAARTSRQSTGTDAVGHRRRPPSTIDITDEARATRCRPTC